MNSPSVPHLVRPWLWFALLLVVGGGSVSESRSEAAVLAQDGTAQDGIAASADEETDSGDAASDAVSDAPQVEGEPAPDAQPPTPREGAAMDAASAGSRKTVVLYLEGPIDWARFSHFRAKLQQAKAARPELLVVVIESPGGLLEESLEMGGMLADVDWAETVVYVPDMALSGAAILSLGADRIVISPRARFGDAGVIAMDENFMWRYAEEKFLSDVVRRIRDLAARRGYPPELAEAMVDRNAVVFYRTLASGKLEYTIEYATEQNLSPDPPSVPAGEPAWIRIEETTGNRFLEVNSVMAERIGLAAPTAETLDTLLDREGARRPVITLRRTTADAVAYWLTRPLIRVLLIVIALAALYFELSAPGIGMGGVVAAIAFGAIFWSSFMGGLAGTLEVVLFLGAFACIAMEVFVIPGFGVAGILGVLMLVASLVLMGQAVIVPDSDLEWRELMNSLGIVTGSGVSFLLIASVMSRYLGSVPVLNRMMLPPPAAAGDGERQREEHKAYKTHAHVKVGDWGEAMTPLRPAGKVHFSEATLDVVSEGSFVEPGSVVRVVEIQGNRIIVTLDERAS